MIDHPTTATVRASYVSHPHTSPSRAAEEFDRWFESTIRDAKTAERERLAGLVNDVDRGLPFDADYDRAIVAGWLQDA